MGFKVGDKVVHWNYGPGEILQVDEKEIGGQSQVYYIVQTRDLTLWVPVDEKGEHCLRYPTPAEEFTNLLEVLAGPGEPLPMDRYDRKIQLTERLKDRSLVTICEVIRDLTLHKNTKKMNDHDSLVLERSKIFLINEWSVSLSIPITQAEQELNTILKNQQARTIK